MDYTRARLELEREETEVRALLSHVLRCCWGLKNMNQGKTQRDGHFSEQPKSLALPLAQCQRECTRNVVSMQKWAFWAAGRSDCSGINHKTGLRSAEYGFSAESTIHFETFVTNLTKTPKLQKM
jgi:hypothetical protein